MSYTATSSKEINQMLDYLEIKSIDDLFVDIPSDVLLKKPLNIAEGISEFEVFDEMKKISNKNKVYNTTFRGAGSYKHLIPEVVKHLSSINSFVTSYTPYQGELSQGYLQAIFEYQSEICDLFDMDVTNSSIYDGASAISEAMLMSLKKNKNKILVANNINPNYLKTLKAYAYAKNIIIDEISCETGKVNITQIKELNLEDYSSFIFQNPNFFGLIENAQNISKILRDNNIEIIEIVNPIAMGLLKTPRECDIDIVCGEAQSLGLDQGFGGPYLGFIATTNKYMRKIPGRIVGQSIDRNNNVSYVLTLQAREQHIRREKASSSICSNQALNALRCSIYLAAMGKEGIKEISRRCFNNAHYAFNKIIEVKGFRNKFESEFFNEFVIECDYKVDDINNYLKSKNIQGPYKLSEYEMMFCLTEANTKEDIENLINLLKEVPFIC